MLTLDAALKEYLRVFIAWLVHYAPSHLFLLQLLGQGVTVGDLQVEVLDLLPQQADLTLSFVGDVALSLLGLRVKKND